MAIKLENLVYRYRTLTNVKRSHPLYLCGHIVNGGNSSDDSHFATDDIDIAKEYVNAMNMHKWNIAYAILNGIIIRPNLPKWGAWETCVSQMGHNIHKALECELATKAVPPAPTPIVSAWNIKDPDDLELETPDGDQVFVCGSGWRIMYGADKGAGDDLVYYVNVGDYQRAIDVLRKYKDSHVTGWGHQLLADLENYMAKSKPDPVASIDEADSFGIGQPNRKSTKQWEPDTPDPDVDLLKSIRDACSR